MGASGADDVRGLRVREGVREVERAVGRVPSRAGLREPCLS